MNFISFFKKLSVLQKISVFILTFYLLLWAISSPLIKYFAKPILLEQGLRIAPEASISFNPFLTQITVSDLTVFKGEEKVLSTEELIIRVTLFRLLFDEIAISKLILNNGFIVIDHNHENLSIAGIDVKPAEQIEVPQKTPSQPEVNDNSAAFPYHVVLPKFTLNNFSIDINNRDKPHHIKLNELVISELFANEQTQDVNISLHSLIDGTEVSLSAEVKMTDGSGEVHSQLSVSGYPINKLVRYVDELSELSGLFSFSSKQTISITPEQLKFHVTAAQIANENLIVGYQEQFFTLEHFQNNITDLVLILNNGELAELAGTSQLSMTNASVYYQDVSQKLGHFEQLALTDISFHLEQSPTIKIGKLLIDDIFASKNESIDLPAIVQLKQLSITDIFLSQPSISVDKIILDTLTTNIVISKEKEIANLVKLPDTQEEQASITQAAEELETEITASTAQLLIALGDFTLINDNQITLLDKSVEPIKARKLFIDTLHLGALSNAEDKKEQQTPFEFIGRSNKYAHFDFKGFTQPFANQPSHHIEGFLKELSLPALSRYMKQAMQMELKSGQLNTDVNVTLTGEELDGNVVILLQGLETAIADSDEAGALIDQGALPFNMALGMLKDSNGDVELDVPLAGSMSDPEFGMSSVITLITQKAIWMATQDYLMTTFIPYANIVSAAMTVGEFALRLRFDDLMYQVKQIEPNEAQQDYLQPFIALMQDKDDTRVNICAISTPADIDLPAGQQVTDKEKIRQLKDIAEQREEAFKEYMIKHGNIASSRLLLCAPKIDSSEDSQPRIELSV